MNRRRKRMTEAQLNSFTYEAKRYKRVNEVDFSKREERRRYKRNMLAQLKAMRGDRNGK